MKHSRSAELIAMTCLAFAFRATLQAQTPPYVQIGSTGAVPSFLITGATGTVHVLECRENMSGNSVWRTLAYATLSNSSWVWEDKTLYGGSTRFYRVVALTNNPPPNPNPERLIWIPPGTFTMGSPANEALRNVLGDNR